ncbi:hypothetical protein [Bradyrhizobium elkanii]
MDKTEALKALKTLVKVAQESDDLESTQKLLKEMANVINKALATPPRS